MFLFFPLAHCYFLSCYFFSYLPTVSFSLLLLSYCYPDWINGTITYFPNTCILTCPLLLSFLLLFFLLAHCFFFSCHFIHTATQMNCYFLSCYFFSHVSTVTFFPVTFFPVTFFPTCPLFLFPYYFFPTATLIESTELSLIFLIPVFLLAHCYFLSCYFFSYLPTVSFFPVTLFILLPKWTVTFFPVTFFPTCPLLLSFLLPFFLLLSFRAPGELWGVFCEDPCLIRVLHSSLHCCI